MSQSDEALKYILLSKYPVYIGYFTRKFRVLMFQIFNTKMSVLNEYRLAIDNQL